MASDAGHLHWLYSQCKTVFFHGGGNDMCHHLSLEKWWNMQIFISSKINSGLQWLGAYFGDTITNLPHTCRLDWYNGQNRDYCVTYAESPHIKGSHLALSITFPSQLRTAIGRLQVTSNSFEISVTVYINVPAVMNQSNLVTGHQWIPLVKSK